MESESQSSAGDMDDIPLVGNTDQMDQNKDSDITSNNEEIQMDLNKDSDITSNNEEIQMDLNKDSDITGNNEEIQMGLNKDSDITSNNEEVQMDLNKDSDITSNNEEVIADNNLSNGTGIWFNEMKPLEFYWGRENELETLQKHWQECVNNVSLVFIDIVGIAGVGKTQLANMFAKKVHNECNVNCIFINGENNKSLADSFRKLAIKLKISRNDSLGKEKPMNTLIREVYKSLFNFPCLFIFENLESHDHQFLDILIEFDNNQPLLDIKPMVLMISREPILRTKQNFETQEIQLHPFTSESATDFFVEALKFSEKDGRCISLVETVGEKLKYHPLAISHAVAYIKNRNSSKAEQKLHKYLHSLELEADSNYYLKNLDEFSKTLHLTMEVSVNKLTRIPFVGPKGKVMLNIISFFAADAMIHTGFVLDILKATHIPDGSIVSEIRSSLSFKKKDEIFQIFHDYSFCPKLTGMKNDFIYIPRCTQEIMRIRLEEQGQATQVLNGLLKVICTSLGRKNILLSQMVHIEKIWDYGVSYELVQEYGNLPQKIATRYFHARKFREAFDFICSSVKTLESIFGTESRYTLRMKYWKGLILKEKNELNDSFQLLEKVYETENTIFGEEDHDCLLTAREIGMVLLKQKKFGEAKIILEDTLKKREEVNGPDHRETLKLLGDVACVHYEQKQYEEAATFYKKLVEMEEQTFGPEDRRTLSTKHNIGTVVFYQGHYNNAEHIFDQVLQAKKRILESDHEDVLETQMWLALSQKLLRRYEEGLLLARKTYESQLNNLGMEDEKTVAAKDLVDSIEEILENSSIEFY